MGMFYKRRDYSTIVGGKNPVVAHEFLGDDVRGKDVIIVDDMISSGGSMLEVAKQLKDRNAGRVFVCTTFGLFTDGFDKFDDYFEKGYINKVVTTNLTYLPPELYEKPYFVQADMSKFLALIIDSLNHDITIGKVLNPLFLCFLAILVIRALSAPMGQIAQIAPSGAYASAAFSTGLLEGYNTCLLYTSDAADD